MGFFIEFAAAVATRLQTLSLVKLIFHNLLFLWINFENKDFTCLVIY